MPMMAVTPTLTAGRYNYDCVALESQLHTLQQQETQEQQRLQQAEQQFNQALADSHFTDRDDFLAALLDADELL